MAAEQGLDVGAFVLRRERERERRSQVPPACPPAEWGYINCDSLRDLCNRAGVNNFLTLRLVVPTASTPAAASEPSSPSSSSSASPHPSPTVVWSTLSGGASSAALLEWAGTGVREAAAGASALHAPFTSPSDFDAAVLASTKLWLVAFVARGVAWCPHCGPTEVSLRKLASAFTSPETSAAVSFAVIDCEIAALRPLCARYRIGRPYTTRTGDVPQLLAFSAGGGGAKRGASPERLLPQQSQQTAEVRAPPPCFRIRVISLTSFLCLSVHISDRQLRAAAARGAGRGGGAHPARVGAAHRGGQRQALLCVRRNQDERVAGADGVGRRRPGHAAHRRRPVAQ